MDTQSNVKSIAIEATVIRADGRIEELGEIARYEQGENPIKRLVRTIRRKLSRKREAE